MLLHERRLRLTGRADLKRATLAGLAAMISVLVVSFGGGVHAAQLHDRLISLGGCAAFALFGVVAARNAAEELAAVVALRGGPGAAGVVRLLTSVGGYLVVLVTLLSLLAVPVQKFLLSGAITGVILGIAAQQSLANLFAGLLLLISRPFTVGEWIVVNSGGMGGTYEGRVRSIGLTFTTLETPDGPLSFPNSGMIAAATGPRRPASAGNEPEQGHTFADDEHSRTLFSSAPGG